jgi:RNA polymerase sigma factor (sigma-70 family)
MAGTSGDGSGSDAASRHEREASFRSAYQEHFSMVYRYVAARSPNYSDVADLSAEVFATLWRRADALSSDVDLRSWLVGVARNVLANHRRGTNRRARLALRVAAEPQRDVWTAPDGELPSRLGRALQLLPSKDREALLLVLWDELSHEEAAKALGCSRNALDVRLHRARRRLARQLGAEHGTAPATGQVTEPETNAIRRNEPRE